MDEWAVGVLCKHCIPTSYLYVVCEFEQENLYLYSLPAWTVFWCSLLGLCILFYKLVSLRLLHSDVLVTVLVKKR